MNQILSMNQNDLAFGNNYNNLNGNNSNGGGNGKLELKTIKKIFAIALIIFGLVMFIGGLIGTITYFTTPKGPLIDYPIISTMQNDNVLTLTIQNDTALDVIEYSWNNGKVSEISGNNELSITRDIIVPEGNNVLKMSIIDINGKLTEVTKSFVGVEIEDTTPPKIELVVVSSRLNITAKTVSETKLSYLTYKWNDDAEVRLNATGDQSSIETVIDIQNGTNTLTVVAVNEKGISDTQVKEFIGIKKPVIEVKKDETDTYLLVKITHDTGIQAVETIFNEKNVILTADRLGGKEVEYKLRLVRGSNTLKIVATSLDNSSENYSGTTVKN